MGSGLGDYLNRGTRQSRKGKPWAYREAVIADADEPEIRRQRKEDEARAEQERCQILKAKIAARHKQKTEPTIAGTGESAIVTRPRRFKGSKKRQRLMEDLHSRFTVAELSEIQKEAIERARIAESATERERRKTPQVWDHVLVDAWLVAGFETLFRLPMQVRPAEPRTSMPDYMPDWWEFWQGRLLVGPDYPPMAKRGIARLKEFGYPEQFEIDRMDEALYWPTKFLKDDPKHAKIVGLGAMWKALRYPVGPRVLSKLQMHRKAFYNMRNYGLRVIAEKLNEGVIL